MRPYHQFPENVPISHREKFNSSNGPCTIVYGDEASKIRIGCFFGEMAYPIYDLDLVPSEIADQGAKTVRTFSRKRVNELVKCFREDEALRVARIRDLNAVYQLEVDGVTIKGRVTTHSTGGRTGKLKLVMTEPYQLERYLNIRPSCFAQAMIGHRTFAEDGTLLPQEVERQEAELKALYREEKERLARPPEHPTLVSLAAKR